MSIQRGKIYFVNLNPVHGKEQAGMRPVLVLSIDTINQLIYLLIIDVIRLGG
ncbi:type II toxin-antitoxin system PemK/MazF family toxin [Microcoleus sp. N9_B2]|jgi:mRNA interferase MazF|uniref:type II toxin-antitoxin system PemK/MazF family toxin n=1 Tax=unclassified Microcoleus TaxID=2642155 RepID=UPI002FD55AF1